jgi:hypothetical protein
MILIEYRWKCEYCGTVSPALSAPDGRPPGWTSHEVFDESLLPILPGKYHFCSKPHFDAWCRRWDREMEREQCY